MSLATYAHPAAFTWTTPLVEPGTIRDARAWARRQLTAKGLPGRVIDDAVLMVSELLTNVLRQAPGAAELTLLVEHNLLTVTCADSDRTPARSGSPDPVSGPGRDLLTADALARACFIRPRAGGGKRVIALIEIADR
jgi:hypothetical protein